MVSETIIQFINTTIESSCSSKLQEYVTPIANVYCNWTSDSILCWPPTLPGVLVKQRCPEGNGIDVTKFAERRCSAEGQWESRPGTNTTTGWTNYTPCYIPEVLQLFRKLGNEDEVKFKIDIALNTRILEIFGFSISFLALSISLAIFYHFRSLRNNRTKIHKNLFIAMIIQVVIRLILYIDQAIIRDEKARPGIDNTAYLCEGSYVLLEYAKTSMFMWMFVEGLYLHTVVTVTVFHGKFPRLLYATLGWGFPIVVTAIWGVVTAQQIADQKCWWGYNLKPFYWIVEGPRLFVLVLNFLFLLNIIRVLIDKIRTSRESDVDQLRKAVRGALFLVPLLGVTNILNIIDAPLSQTPIVVAIWFYLTHFLSSFQGLFLSMLYCFLNGEVRTAIKKSIMVYMSIRGHHEWVAKRQSVFSNSAQQDTIAPSVELNRLSKKKQKHNAAIKWCCCSQKHCNSLPDEPANNPETTV